MLKSRALSGTGLDNNESLQSRIADSSINNRYFDLYSYFTMSCSGISNKLLIIVGYCETFAISTNNYKERNFSTNIFDKKQSIGTV